MGRMFKCCAKGNVMNTIDLSMIVDVDASSNQNCCGGRDEVYIKSNNESGGQTSTLYVDLAQGPKVVITRLHTGASTVCAVGPTASYPQAIRAWPGVCSAAQPHTSP